MLFYEFNFLKIFVKMNDKVHISYTPTDSVCPCLLIIERRVKIFNSDCGFYISPFGSVFFCLMYLEDLLLDSDIFRFVMSS